MTNLRVGILRSVKCFTRGKSSGSSIPITTRSLTVTLDLANGPDIYMPTEFLHGLYDGGIGAGMWDYWELIRNSKVGGGGFFWALVDECVKRTDQNDKLDCAGNRGPDGIVGPHREHKGSFNTVREIWSPVYLKVNADKSSVQLDLENRYDFTNLNTVPSSGVSLVSHGQMKVEKGTPSFRRVYSRRRMCCHIKVVS